MARLRSDFWISAYLRQCHVDGIPAVLRRRGHEEAGAIFIKVDHGNGTASLFGPKPQDVTEQDERYFSRFIEAAFSGDVEMRIEKEIRFDPDLWLLEVDSRSEVNNFPWE